MIVAFSTSSPWTSVALLSVEGDVLWQAVEHAPRRAGEESMEMLKRMEQDCSFSLDKASLFCADIGPGSFTGVRVGVTLAKTFAFVYGAAVAGATAFDLIDADRTVIVPSRKGEFFVREPGKDPYTTRDVPTSSVGYGNDEYAVAPNAARFAALLDRIERTTPEVFVPGYLTEPSISQPKKAFPIMEAT